MNYNHVTIVGRVAKDIKIGVTPKGISIATFDIATNRFFKVDGQKKTDATFHHCVAYAKHAENIHKYSGRGRLILVEGRLGMRTWEQDGVKKYRTEVIIEEFQIPPKALDYETREEVESLPETFDEH